MYPSKDKNGGDSGYEDPDLRSYGSFEITKIIKHPHTHGQSYETQNCIGDVTYHSLTAPLNAKTMTTAAIIARYCITSR